MGTGESESGSGSGSGSGLESGADSGQPKADSREWGMEIRDSGMGIGDSGIMYTKGAVKKWSSFFHSPFFTYSISW